jgi:hypothetical protein
MLDASPDYVDCPDCGTSLAPHALERHRCDRRHRDDHAARTARVEASSFVAEFRAYLATPQGRFEVYYAARTRPG